jgi:hypothetical protein
MIKETNIRPQLFPAHSKCLRGRFFNIDRFLVGYTCPSCGILVSKWIHKLNSKRIGNTIRTSIKIHCSKCNNVILSHVRRTDFDRMISTVTKRV